MGAFGTPYRGTGGLAPGYPPYSDLDALLAALDPQAFDAIVAAQQLAASGPIYQMQRNAALRGMQPVNLTEQLTRAGIAPTEFLNEATLAEAPAYTAAGLSGAEATADPLLSLLTGSMGPLGAATAGGVTGMTPELSAALARSMGTLYGPTLQTTFGADPALAELLGGNISSLERPELGAALSSNPPLARALSGDVGGMNPELQRLLLGNVGGADPLVASLTRGNLAGADPLVAALLSGNVASMAPQITGETRAATDAFLRQLSPALIEGVENPINASLAAQGMSQAPGIIASTYAQALAPYQMQEEQLASQMGAGAVGQGAALGTDILGQGIGLAGNELSTALGLGQGAFGAATQLGTEAFGQANAVAQLLASMGQGVLGSSQAVTSLLANLGQSTLGQAGTLQDLIARLGQSNLERALGLSAGALTGAAGTAQTGLSTGVNVGQFGYGLPFQVGGGLAGVFPAEHTDSGGLASLLGGTVPAPASPPAPIP